DLDHEDGTFHPAGTTGVFHTGFKRDLLQRLLNKHGISDVQFVTAYAVERGDKVFPIFLVLGQKSAPAA
ncbi:MAG: class I SAM-dependent methyltransferase, partial [SAR86 cluster bacterium]